MTPAEQAGLDGLQTCTQYGLQAKQEALGAAHLIAPQRSQNNQQRLRNTAMTQALITHAPGAKPPGLGIQRSTARTQALLSLMRLVPGRAPCLGVQRRRQQLLLLLHDPALQGRLAAAGHGAHGLGAPAAGAALYQGPGKSWPWVVCRVVSRPLRTCKVAVTASMWLRLRGALSARCRPCRAAAARGRWEARDSCYSIHSSPHQ